MSKIGIIFAMEEELKELKKQVKIINTKKIYDCTFYEGNINKHEVILVESGVGKVNAARCCQILIDHINPDYIFNIGVAGGINPKVSIGDIIVGEKLVQHDFDITAFNHKKGYVPKVGNDVSSDILLVKKAMQTSTKAKIHKGIIATGDVFLTEQEKEEEIAKTYGALCAEMEGASIAQVCYLSKIPFLVIRSISDSSYEGNVIDNYEEFLKKTSKIVADYLISIIKNI